MPNKSQQKGDLLERAVFLIQESILKSDPKLTGTSFSIEIKKLLIIDNVRHEIDVFVKTHEGSPYEASWLFECKNWSKPASKNDVIILAEKVNASGAATGFLVAREFSKDAEAQAAKSPHIKLISCNDDFPNPLSIEMYHIITDPWGIRIFLQERNVPPSPNPKNFDGAAIMCFIDNTPRDFHSYAMMFVDQMVAEMKGDNRYFNVGEHFTGRLKEIYYEKKQLVVNGMDVEKMTISSFFWISVVNRKIISKFELEGQGRVYSLEPFEDDKTGEKIEINIIHRFRT